MKRMEYTKTVEYPKTLEPTKKVDYPQAPAAKRRNGKTRHVSAG
jgi:hypothetical protein